MNLSLPFLRLFCRAQMLFQLVLYDSIGWKITGSDLRVNIVAINKDFKTPVVVRRKGELADALFVFRKELVRQTDGFGFIMSRGAIFNTDLHKNLRQND
jgi:hypothetical protein